MLREESSVFRVFLFFLIAHHTREAVAYENVIFFSFDYPRARAKLMPPQKKKGHENPHFFPQLMVLKLEIGFFEN